MHSGFELSADAFFLDATGAAPETGENPDHIGFDLSAGEILDISDAEPQLSKG